MGEVGTRRWAARRGADGSARSRRGAEVSHVRERERARVRTAGRGHRAFFIDEVRRFARHRALCVTTPIYGKVGAVIFAQRVI